MNTLSKQNYASQKCSAKKRGIDFNLTYDEWYDFWIKSGKAHLRGRGTDKYCMARHNDTGPYELGNISFLVIFSYILNRVSQYRSDIV